MTDWHLLTILLIQKTESATLKDMCLPYSFLYKMAEKFCLYIYKIKRGKWLWILKAQLGKNSWHASCPVYNLILTRRWPYKNLWTMDYLLHCCECESWNQTKNRRERDRDEYISLLFLCLADCTMYVYMENVCFFLPASQYLLRGYSMVLYSTKSVMGIGYTPFLCVQKIHFNQRKYMEKHFIVHNL